MQYRRDKYGRELSVLGFGCMRFTKKGTAIDLEKAEKEIMAAFRAGFQMLSLFFSPERIFLTVSNDVHILWSMLL